jgi:hypothetical protein
MGLGCARYARRVVVLYGIASKQSKDVDEFLATRGEAERALEQVLHDEPNLAGVLYVAEIELEASNN